MIMNIEYLMN